MSSIHAKARESLMDALEELCRDRPLSAISARDVGRASGHRNNSVVQYHFGHFDLLIATATARRFELLRAANADALRWAAENHPGYVRLVAGALIDPELCLLVPPLNIKRRNAVILLAFGDPSAGDLVALLA